ncbi:hypothetical protein JTB14_030267 [Gonioctena quinquepunctata]|nr:hypothetical protein JTB14_030267 [Gonioctena quinquepunctata]
MMASEYYKHEAELSVGDIGEVKEELPEIKPSSNHGNEQNASGNQFDALLILKEELVEEDPTETKPLSEYGVFTDCLDKNEDIFYDPILLFEVMQKNGKNPKESKFSPTHSFENTECLAGDSTKPKVNHNNGVMLKNEDGDHSKCTEDSSTNKLDQTFAMNFQQIPKHGPNKI